MPDFIDRLGAELTRAATAELDQSPAGRVRWWSRWRRSVRPRTLVIVPVLAVLSTGAALAAGILLTGSPVGPRVPPVPTAGYGAATTAKLLPIRVADPAGGLPWGLRPVRTTRGDVCLQVGRLTGGMIGALGEDGAFGNDHRFHPFSPNYEGPDQMDCVPVDARGHGFINIVITGLPTSALAIGCIRDFSRYDVRPCRTQDTRDIYFGLLGPEAASITYASASGRTVTEPTVGRDGAYLIVTRAVLTGQQGAPSVFSGLLRTGVIRAVTYRDGRTCRPTAVSGCAPVGLVTVTSHLTQAELASPVHVRQLPGRIPASPSFPAQLRFTITYTARVAATNTGSFYYTTLFFPPNSTRSGCHESATGHPTAENIRAGQRLVDHESALASCHGTIHGIVRYHPASAIHSAAPAPQVTNPGDITVGRFSLRLP